MRFVVDASVVVGYLLGDAAAAERAAILGRADAPSFLDVEVTHSLRGLLRGGKIDEARADTARAELHQLGLARRVDATLLPRAWELRDVCTTYDALYVALAETLGATLVTRDARLARGVGGLVTVAVA